MRKTPISDSVCVILATAPSRLDAETIARNLIEEKLIACATILSNATSLYRWEGKIVVQSEVQMMIKTRVEVVTQVQEKFTTLHPYNVPEFIVLNADSGGAEYLAWVSSEVNL